MFATMLGGCREPTADPTARVLGGSAERGRALIGNFGCGSCHEIPGVRGARGLTGPSLHAFAHRSHIAGRIANTPDNLIAWIVNPKGVDSITVMPVLGVTVVQARDIAAYLYTLQEGVLGPPHLFPVQWLQRAGEFGR